MDILYDGNKGETNGSDLKWLIQVFEASKSGVQGGVGGRNHSICLIFEVSVWRKYFASDNREDNAQL